MASSQSLFEHEGERRAKQQAPLADRLRPQSFDEFVGQEHIVGPDRVLRRAIAAQRVPSFILWGPRNVSDGRSRGKSRGWPWCRSSSSGPSMSVIRRRRFVTVYHVISQVMISWRILKIITNAIML